MLVTAVFYFFTIAWCWLTVRLRTMKQTIIRMIVSLFFTVFNVIGIFCSFSFKDDRSAFFIVLIFNGVLALAWSIRLITDIVFLAGKDFDEKEKELSDKIKNKFSNETREKDNNENSWINKK